LATSRKEREKRERNGCVLILVMGEGKERSSYFKIIATSQGKSCRDPFQKEGRVRGKSAMILSTLYFLAAKRKKRRREERKCMNRGEGNHKRPLIIVGRF